MSIEQIEQLIDEHYPDNVLCHIEPLNNDKYLCVTFDANVHLYACVVIAKSRCYFYSMGFFMDTMKLFHKRMRYFANKIMR